MSLKSPYLAAENSAMDRRSRGLHRFLVASPVILLLAVGLVGHIKKPPHAGAAGSSAYDEHVLAYRQPVIDAQKLIRFGPEAATPDTIKTAEEWISGYRSGKLVALTPAAFEDHLRDGVRGEVFRIGIGLSSTLALKAQREMEAGNVSSAANLGMLCAETANGLRGFEVEAHLQGLLVARRGIETVTQAWPKLSATEKDELRPRLRAILTDPKEVDQLADMEDRQFRAYQIQQQITPKAASVSADQLADKRQREATRRSAGISNERIQALIDDSKPNPATKTL